MVIRGNRWFSYSGQHYSTYVSHSMSAGMIVIISSGSVRRCTAGSFICALPLPGLASCLFPRHASLGHPFATHRGSAVESHNALESLPSFFPSMDERTRPDFSNFSVKKVVRQEDLIHGSSL
jgi:hypothetical protein